VLLARRSSLVTSNTSPPSREAMARAKAGRFVFAPLSFSLKTFWAPGAVNAAICASNVCASVETRAYP
jgi:hypothetical protein